MEYRGGVIGASGFSSSLTFRGFASPSAGILSLRPNHAFDRSAQRRRRWVPAVLHAGARSMQRLGVLMECW